MELDLLFAGYCLALFALPLIIYKLTLPDSHGREKRTKDWHYAIKRLLCHRKLTKFMNRTVELPRDGPRTPPDQWVEDVLTFHALDLHGSSLFLRMAVGRLGESGRTFAEIGLQLRLADGRSFMLPQGVVFCSLGSTEWRTKILTVTRQLDGNFRIVFNGFLREVLPKGVVKAEEGKVEHVGFNLIFVRASEGLRYPRFFNRGLFGDAVCRVQWRDGSWTEKLGDQVGESHFGMLHGPIRGTEFGIESILRMGAYQSRRFGTGDRYECSRSVGVLTMGDEGTLSYVEHKRIALSPSTQVRHGAVLLPNGKTTSVTGCDLPLPDQCGDITSMTVHIATPRKRLKNFITILEHTELIYNSTNSDSSYSISTKLGNTTTLEGRAQSSIVFFRRTPLRTEQPIPIDMPILIQTNFNKSIRSDLILPLDIPEAKNVNLTGGKGQSLAILTELQRESGFKVPPGFIITTRALQEHLETDHQAFRSTMLKLKLYTTPETIKESCKSLQNLIMTTSLSKDLGLSVQSALERIRPLEGHDPSYAVRSSGVSEDSELTSAAGQNETYLGCRTLEEILIAVRKCWASLYSFRSVEYRRNRCLDIETAMAVVVQEMTNSRIAGVLFTCDLDGNPGRIRIVSSHGLGESVVSGEEGGDLVYVRRTWDDQVSIEKEEPGTKQSKMVLSSKGVQKIVLCDTQGKEMSISTLEGLKLAKIAAYLEGKYEKHLDIEWAFEGDQVLLHQARPVTFLDNWGDWELEHEFDAAILCDRDIFTTANIKEVMPDAVTPLTNSVVTRTLDQSTLRLTKHAGRHKYMNNRPQRIITVGHHSFIDFYRVLMKYPADSVNISTRAIDLSICGHVVTTPEMLRRALAIQGHTTMFKSLQVLWDMLLSCYCSGRVIEAAIKLGTEPFPPNCTGVMDIIHAIDCRLKIFSELADAHNLASKASSFYQIIMLTILGSENANKNNPDTLTPEKFTQISLLFSSGDGVISAEIPSELEEIAREIRVSPLRNAFIEEDPKMVESCEGCLQKIPDAWEKFVRFLERHGHRTFKEMELIEIAWIDDTSILLKMLQTLARLDLGTPKTPQISIPEVITRLQTKINHTFLGFLIGKCRSGVATRERSKSELVRQLNVLRGAFQLLAKRLHQIHTLPTTDLIYFLTYDEIKYLTQHADPMLIAKAMRRKRLYPSWNRNKFPEMSVGFPTPLQRKPFGGSDTQKQLKGTPVCGGFVKARCCAIDDLARIDELQQDDVLITHGTDVAWTPYFPIVSGVVTELGGLISHGAVVAREYGLPCLVGVEGALDVFQTGDYVVLDASGGSLYKVSPDNPDL